MIEIVRNESFIKEVNCNNFRVNRKLSSIVGTVFNLDKKENITVHRKIIFYSPKPVLTNVNIRSIKKKRESAGWKFPK